MTEQFEFGPKMRVLTEKQRAFVMAMVEFPGQSHAESARMAGYSDHKERAKVTACLLLQDKKIIEAIQEQAGKKMWAISLKAAGRVEQLIDSDDPAVALKAALSTLDRVGIAPQQTINVNQHMTDDSGKAILERIAALSQRLGIPVPQLLSKPVVDAEFSEVKDG